GADPFARASDEGWPLFASRSAFHWTRYAAATSLLSIRRPLFSWVQRPVVVQFVLPVQTRFALPCASATTRNLLCASAPGETNRSVCATSTCFARSRSLAALFSSCVRSSALCAPF